MALVTANGQDVIETWFRPPRTGAWHADILVDDPDQIIGQVTLVIDGGALTLVGTAMRTGVFVDTGRLRVVAGAGGLGTSATPKHYNGTSVRIVLGDLLEIAGETLSSTADSSILDAALDAWTTTANPVGTLISQLLAAAAPGVSWRMLPDGTLWVGKENWSDSGLDPATYQILSNPAEENSMYVGVDAPILLPGTTFEGQKVSFVEHHVGQGDDGVRMRVWFEPSVPAAADRLRTAIAAAVQAAAARTDKIDYGRLYPAMVVSQAGSTIDVQPDQVNGLDLLPDMAAVPLLLGLPGASVNGVAGGRVQIGWLGGDPSKPFAISFDSSNSVQTLVLAVLGQLFLGDQATAVAALMGATYRAAEGILNKALIAAFGALAGASTGPLSALQGQFTAIANALTAFESTSETYLAQKVLVA
jgi:hypothetical protein